MMMMMIIRAGYRTELETKRTKLEPTFLEIVGLMMLRIRTTRTELVNEKNPNPGFLPVRQIHSLANVNI